MDDLDGWKPYSQIFVPARLQTVEVSGKHYGVPWFGLVFGFAYHKSVLDGAKQSPPKTWVDLAAVAKAVTVAGKQYGFGAAMGQGLDSAYRVYPFALVNGGRFMTEDLTKFTFNDPANVAALQLFMDLKKDGSTVPGMDSWDGGKEGDAFRSGIVEMGLAANWPGRLQKPEVLAEWQLLPLPQPEKPTGAAAPATLSDDVMLAITAQSKNKPATFQMVQSLMNDQTSIERAVTPGLLYPPVVQSAFQDPRWQQVWGHDALAYELEHSVPWPYSTVLGEAQSIYALAVSKAFTGQASAQQALDEGVAKAQTLFKS
jgi:multiple sugar transport system substrate-binding protein